MKTVQELLVQGDAVFATDLTAAETAYAEAFKLADREREAEGYQFQLQGITRLGDVYAKRPDGHTKATALYSYGLNICEKMLGELESEDEKKHFQEKIPLLKENINQIEGAFFAWLSEQGGRLMTNQYPYDQVNENHRRQLEEVRQYAREQLEKLDKDYPAESVYQEDNRNVELELKRAEGIRDLYHQIAERMKAFICVLLKECQETLGDPPCDHAVIGLGSLAREEMTPFSDLEFAILIEDLGEALTKEGITDEDIRTKLEKIGISFKNIAEVFVQYEAEEGDYKTGFVKTQPSKFIR